jgi:hypothetical protein
MPLTRGYSREAIAANIRRELHAGAPQDQAVAIALETARGAYRARHRRGRLPRTLRRNPPMQRRRNPSDDSTLLLVAVGAIAFFMFQSQSRRPVLSTAAPVTSAAPPTVPTTTAPAAVAPAAASGPPTKPPGPHYWTVNGWQTLDSMAAQLRAVGWDGSGDVAQVYAKTTGGQVTYYP